MKDRITQQPAPVDTPAAATAMARRAESFRRPTGRASYPRRVTLDLTDDQYLWLRATAHKHRISAAGLLRASLDHLSQDPDALEKIVHAADATENPPLT